ncbi:hypothetical protein SAMN05421780_101103 [Flexibacter flexilis DSM 6793]|uniref:Uncharacterized protein n=1 Tax=Flexibacter flexilis DSM 6793 TaxID=927664 RepID=A0A1I1DB88_9BACT|nr:hypothetical protein [Flexibacter flexilis]SFB72289.1 hypothetical protein SAMN05421780_101103 [Flexibacter flexilis DSM 6793]
MNKDDNKISFSFYHQNYFRDKQNLKKLWNLLDTKLVNPTRFDTVERAKKEFTQDSVEQAYNEYLGKEMLFVKGSKLGFCLSIHTFSNPSITVSTFYFNEKLADPKNMNCWFEWIKKFCEHFPIFFGYGCSFKEYNLKHKVITELGGGKQIIGAVGVSALEFLKYNSGIYWTTILGNALVSETNVDKLDKNEMVTVSQIKHHQAMITLNENILQTDYSTRLMHEKSIAEILNPAYFFDRNYPNFEYKQANEILNKISNQQR